MGDFRLKMSSVGPHRILGHFQLHTKEQLAGEMTATGKLTRYERTQKWVSEAKTERSSRERKDSYNKILIFLKKTDGMAATRAVSDKSRRGQLLPQQQHRTIHLSDDEEE